jgi:acyl-coenzyme A synthetase/AMP-(fatty) acid ligase
VIYTSGSTGRPKGVVVAHRSLLNFLHSMALEPGIGPQDTLLAVTTLTFDIAALELLLPLTVGAEVVIAQDDDAMDGQALSGLIEQHHVTMMQATPSTWRAMLDAGWSGVGPRPFKALIGGEALTPMLARQLLPLCTELWNMYGPTETTVWSTCWRVQDPDHGIYIGRPIANTRVRIVDACGHDCPIGIPGEIVIEGDGVTDGYWQRDELTAQRFLMDIRDNGRPDRAYRTGDLGRWTWSGQLQHLGRLDHQIKVRGHRIEPGDIEAQFMRQPEVAQCVVLLREDQPGDQRLVAYVVRHDPDAPEPDATRWRQALRQHLPDYMVPQHVVWLKALPLLRNGKLDRHALPAPTTTPSASGEAPAITLTAWEARLAEVWRELLHIPSVTPTDNFFDLGGYSLLAMQAISRLAETTGIRISPRHYIFETLGQLAHTYAQAGSSSVAAHDASTTTPNSRMKTPATAKADAPTPSLFRRLLQSLRS